MQIPVIKDLVAKYSIDDLKKAEDDLLEEKELSIEVGGEDEGEQLTHILAAIWVIHEMDKQGIPVGKAIREYTVKVRKSIS